MGRIEIYSKEGELLSSIPTSKELCEHLLSLSDQEALREVAIMLLLFLRKELEFELTPEQVLGELKKVVICGREIEVE